LTTGPFWELHELSGEQRILLSDTRARLHDDLSSLDKDPQTYSMIHADLHPANVMMAGESLHVIDFDDAGFGFHAYDLAMALFGLPEADFPTLRDALVRGYCRHRPLDDVVLSLMPTFDLVRRLALLGWLHARPDQSRDYLRELLDRACAQAAEL
jgi:Ser/Thr protein kinase RdoA (MazF antagonist)